MDIFCLKNSILVFGTKAGWRAEMPDLIPNHGFVGQQGLQCRVLLLPVFPVIGIGSKLKIFVCPYIKGIKVFSADRPAAVRDPVPFFKINLIQSGTEAGPMTGSAAQIM